MTDKKTSSATALVGLIVLAGFGWYYFGGGLESQTKRNMENINQQAANEMKRIEQQVAADAVKQYDIAKRNGTAMDACVQAGMVAAAYLQAKDESEYKRWKQIEKSDCALAGLSR